MTETKKPGLAARFRALALPGKMACWAAVLLLLFTVVGFWLVPPVARMVLEKKLPGVLHRPVSIGKITLNPFSLEVAVENFHIGQKEGAGDLLAFERLVVNLESASLFKRALIIQSFSLTGPRVEFSRIGDQTYSFSDLLAEDPAKKAAPPGPAKPFQFAIRNIEIKGGRLIFHDLPKKTDHSVTDLNLGVPSLSNLPYQVETYVQPAFSATINGTPFALGGQSKPFAKSLESVLELKASGINIPEYLAYIPNSTGLVLQSALLDVDARLHLLARPDNTYRLAVIGRVALRELAIADKAGQTYLKIPELAVTLADSDLLAKEVHVNEISLQSPTIKLERLADGRLLPLALLVAPEPSLPGGRGTKAAPVKAEKSGKGAGEPLKLDLDKVVLSDGRVDYLDQAAGATVSTRLDIDTAVHMLSQADKPSLAVIGRVALRNLALADKSGKSYLKLPELALTLAEGNLLANEVHFNEVHFSEISLKSPVVNLERLADGRLLPLALVLPSDKPGPVAGAPKATPENPGQFGSAPAEPLKLLIDRLVMDNGQLDVLDAAVAAGEDPAHLALRELTIRVADLSNTPEALAKMSLAGKINATAKLQLTGQIGLEPVQARLNLQLTDLALSPFQPYIADQARLIIAGGTLAVAGDLSLRSPHDGPLWSDFQGEAAIANLATVDTVLGEDLVKWRNLGLKKIHYSSDLGLFSVAAVDLANPYVNVWFGKDGVLNLTTIRPDKAPAAPPAVPETPPAPPENAAAKSFTTTIGRITVSGGQLDFLDRQVEPVFGASLADFSGSISDLSSMEESSAEVKFVGKLDQQAPMLISGRINPLRKDLLVDLKVDFTDINLSPMSPYGGKYIGYKIDKGKLNLDLKYDIANRKLNSQNKVFLDQFTLGQTVESPDAANLPVRLALALLRDRKGGITLDLPVEGSLDDPSFRIGKVVIQVLINLISKAATSPLALLGALIPEGQDIHFIAFAPGLSEITPEAGAKVATVEKVLFERPELRMDLIGKVDPVADRAALARLHLSNSVKLQKLLAGGRGGKDSAGQVAGVELSADEYPTFLTLAYQASRKGAKDPKPAKDTPPPPDVATMEAALLAGIKVGEDELRLLALERASQVVTTLAAGGKVEPGRLFVVEPKVGGAGEAANAAQVELVIK